MPFLLHTITKFLLFVAVLVIVGLPASRAFSGAATHHHNHHQTSRQSVKNVQYFEHGLHDISFDFLNKKHLSTPPVLLKLRATTIICLLFSLFFVALGLIGRRFGLFSFFSTKKPAPVYQRYLVYQTFLI